MVIGGLIAAAVVLGGGGSPAPGSEMLLQLVAAIAALALAFGPTAMRDLPMPGRAAWAVAALVLLIPIAQLVPLPPGWWQELPGRALAVESLALVGEAESWRPWTLFPGRTLAGLLATVVPVIVLLAVSRLDAHGHRVLLGLVAALALASLVLGALQLAGGPASPLRFYSHSNPGFLNGFQANRNAAADILLIGIVALGAWSAARVRPLSLFPTVGFAALGCVLLALGVVLTGSRTGIVMLVPVIGLAALIVFGAPTRRGPAMLAVGVAASLTAAAAALLLSANPALNRVAGRFTLDADLRLGLWNDALYAIGIYWPFGAGIGSAAPVITLVERLELVDPTRPNRVHNDFLELALETGVFGPLVLAAIVLLLICKTVLRLRNTEVHNRPMTLAALAIFAIIAIHSLVDYPLRSMAPACLAALAAGMVLARNPRGPLVAGDGGTE